MNIATVEEYRSSLLTRSAEPHPLIISKKIDSHIICTKFWFQNLFKESVYLNDSFQKWHRHMDSYCPDLMAAVAKLLQKPENLSTYGKTIQQYSPKRFVISVGGGKARSGSAIERAAFSAFGISEYLNIDPDCQDEIFSNEFSGLESSSRSVCLNGYAERTLQEIPWDKWPKIFSFSGLEDLLSDTVEFSYNGWFTTSCEMNPICAELKRLSNPGDLVIIGPLTDTIEKRLNSLHFQKIAELDDDGKYPVYLKT